MRRHCVATYAHRLGVLFEVYNMAMQTGLYASTDRGGNLF